MGKLFGIISIVAALWVTAEVITNGVDGAFDGAFAGSGSATVQDRRSIPERAGNAAERARDIATERRERLLPD